MSETKGKKVYSCNLPVRWGDMDAYGHVNNALYMRYLEEARVQLFTELGVTMDGNGIAPVIINVGCTFMKPLNYPDTIRIDCYVDDPGRSSLMTYYQIFSSADLNTAVSEGYSKVVWMDHRTGRSVPLPDHVRALLD